MRLNKLFWAWKLQVRQGKVNRLKQTIVRHSVYKHLLTNCFREWREQGDKMRRGFQLLEKLSVKRLKKVLFSVIRHQNDDRISKNVNNRAAMIFYQNKSHHKGFQSFFNFIGLHQQMKENLQKAKILNQKHLKKRYLKMLKLFSQMRDKKLESVRRVKTFFDSRLVTKALLILRTHAEHSQEKDTNVRKALQFQVLRHNRYYPMMRAFKALQIFPKLKADKTAQRTELVKAFRLKRLFSNLKDALVGEAQDEAQLITEHMRNRYFTMWRLQLNQEKRDKTIESEVKERHDTETKKKIIFAIRGTLQRQKQLNSSEEKVKSAHNHRVLTQVISTFNSIRQVKFIRNQALCNIIDKLSFKLLLTFFNKIRTHVNTLTMAERSKDFNRKGLLRQALSKLRTYQMKKAKEDNDFRVARRFRYVSLLQIGFKGLSYAKRFRLIKINAILMHKRQLFIKVWIRLSGLDEVTLFKINKAKQKLRQNLLKQYAKTCINALFDYSQRQQEKRSKNAMAMVQHDNRIIKKSFFGYKQIIRKLRRLKSLKRYFQDHLNEIKINHFFAQWRAKSAKKSNIREIQQLYLRHLLQNRLIRLLKNNVFQQVKRREVQVRIQSSRCRRAMKKVIIGLKSYRDYAQEKTKAISNAFEERKRSILVEKFMKLARVAFYWKNQKQGVHDYTNFDRTKARMLFTKWKFITFQDGIQIKTIQALPKHVERVAKKSPVKQLDAPNHIQWLQKFDQKYTVESRVKHEENKQAGDQKMYETYMDRKKEDLEARHRLKLKEFDQFLDQITQSSSKLQRTEKLQPPRHMQESAPIQYGFRLETPIQSGQFTPKLLKDFKTQNMNIPAHNIRIMTNDLLSSDPSHHFPNHYQPQYQQVQQQFHPLVSCSSNKTTPVLLSPISHTSTRRQDYKNESVNSSSHFGEVTERGALCQHNIQDQASRLHYLQGEIEKFLKDKELLRQLEASTFTRDGKACKLLRDEIHSRSEQVTDMINELIVLKGSKQ